MRLLNMIMIPAALAIAPAAIAAPTSPGGTPDKARATEATTVQYYYDNHRRYETRRYWRPYRYHYSPQHCFWSRYLHRTICR